MSLFVYDITIYAENPSNFKKRKERWVGGLKLASEFRKVIEHKVFYWDNWKSNFLKIFDIYIYFY